MIKAVCSAKNTGSMSRYFSSSQWQFTGVSMAAHHRSWRSTAAQSQVLTFSSTCILPFVNYKQYHWSCSTFTHIRLFQLLGKWFETLTRILSGTQQSVQIVWNAYSKCIRSLYTRALGVLDDYRAKYKSIHLITLLTLLTYIPSFFHASLFYVSSHVWIKSTFVTLICFITGRTSGK